MSELILLVHKKRMDTTLRERQGGRPGGPGDRQPKWVLSSPILGTLGWILQYTPDVLPINPFAQVSLSEFCSRAIKQFLTKTESVPVMIIAQFEYNSSDGNLPKKF